MIRRQHSVPIPCSCLIETHFYYALPAACDTDALQNIPTLPVKVCSRPHRAPSAVVLQRAPLFVETSSALGLPRGLHAPQHQSRDGHHEERNAGNIEQCFLETEEIELVDLHDEEVKLSPAAFVFQNFARLPVYNYVGSIVIVEPYTHGVLSMVFF